MTTTPPGAWPTREEIAQAILYGENILDYHARRGVMPQDVQTSWALESDDTKRWWLSKADALLARLRPAWDTQEGVIGVDADEYHALAKEYDALRAALAACVAALTRAVYEGRAITLAAEEPTKEWWAIHRLVYDAMRAALAQAEAGRR